jgi:hypothetical protein
MNAVSQDVPDQIRIRESLGACQFVGPEREAVHHHAGFHEHMEGDARHVERGVRTIASRAFAFQHNGDVGVAVWLVIAARTAAVENGVDDGILALEALQKDARGALGGGIDARRRRARDRHGGLAGKPRNRAL